MKKLLLAIALTVAPMAYAQAVAFVPPNDTVGQVFTTNSNDAWSGGRGLVFQATANVTISSIGVFQNLASVPVNWSVSEVTSASGNVSSGATVLRSGTVTANTSGSLAWVDATFPALTLQAGRFYHIEFRFSGNSAQNFFYNNNNVTWTQGAFSVLDGTSGGSTTNTVVAAFRVSSGGPVGIPTLSEWGMIAMAMGLILFGVHQLRQRGASLA